MSLPLVHCSLFCCCWAPCLSFLILLVLKRVMRRCHLLGYVLAWQVVCGRHLRSRATQAMPQHRKPICCRRYPSRAILSPLTQRMSYLIRMLMLHNRLLICKRLSPLRTPPCRIASHHARKHENHEHFLPLLSNHTRTSNTDTTRATQTRMPPIARINRLSNHIMKWLPRQFRARRARRVAMYPCQNLL